MIIFDLDGCLADCEHRRHFVDPKKTDECDRYCYLCYNGTAHCIRPCSNCSFKPDWKAFYEACDGDKPIESTIEVFRALRLRFGEKTDVRIWSGRCESVRDKTEQWLRENIPGTAWLTKDRDLKMRPIGDSTPDEMLKERWLDEAIAQGKTIDFVFDDRPKVVRMWRRRGIFVFNCLQHDREF